MRQNQESSILSVKFFLVYSTFRNCGCFSESSQKTGPEKVGSKNWFDRVVAIFFKFDGHIETCFFMWYHTIQGGNAANSG